MKTGVLPSNSKWCPTSTGDHHAYEEAKAAREVERRDGRISADSSLTGKNDTAEPSMIRFIAPPPLAQRTLIVDDRRNRCVAN